MKNKNYSVIFLQKIHELIIILWFAALVIFIGFSSLRFFGAIYLSLIGITNLIFGACPLTSLEGHLLKKAGVEKRVKNFTPRFFKKYFGFQLNYKIVRIFMLLTSSISIIYLIIFGAI